MEMVLICIAGITTALIIGQLHKSMQQMQRQRIQRDKREARRNTR